MIALVEVQLAKLPHVNQQVSVDVLDQSVPSVSHMGVNKVVDFIGKEMEDFAKFFIHFLGVAKICMELLDVVV